MHHHDLYYVPVVSCSYLVRLVLSLFLLTLLSHGLPACRLSALVAVINIALYLGRGAWGVAAELELGFAAGSKKDVCRTDDFHHRLDHFRSTRVPHGLQGP